YFAVGKLAFAVGVALAEKPFATAVVALPANWFAQLPSQLTQEYDGPTAPVAAPDAVRPHVRPAAGSAYKLAGPAPTPVHFHSRPVAVAPSFLVDAAIYHAPRPPRSAHPLGVLQALLWTQ